MLIVQFTIAATKLNENLDTLFAFLTSQLAFYFVGFASLQFWSLKTQIHNTLLGWRYKNVIVFRNQKSSE